MEKLTHFFVNPKDSPDDKFYISIVLLESWCVRYVQDSGSDWDSDIPDIDTVEEYKCLKKQYRAIYDNEAWITWMDTELKEATSTYSKLLEWNTNIVLQYKSYEIIPSGSIVQTNTHIGMIEKDIMVTSFMYSNILNGGRYNKEYRIGIDYIPMIKSYIHISLDLHYGYSFGIYTSETRGLPNPTTIDIDTYGPLEKPPLPYKFTYEEYIEYIINFLKLPNSIYHMRRTPYDIYMDIKII